MVQLAGGQAYRTPRRRGAPAGERGDPARKAVREAGDGAVTWWAITCSQSHRLVLDGSRRVGCFCFCFFSFFFVIKVPDLSFDCLGIHFKDADLE